jgi:Head domain of trimeric autotransporter adhesin/Chaperone of endosialidase
MKKIIILLLFIASQKIIVAQNVGIGTTEPMNKLQVQGNLLVNTPTTATNTPPTVAQTKTMLNGGTISFAASDSIGRIYDPGGQSGNYASNQISNANISGATGATGVELTFESIDLSSFDSLIIKEPISGTILLTVGNFYTNAGKWIFNSSSLFIIFKSNGDANVGAGFSLLFRRLYTNSTTLPDLSGYTGNAFFFNTKNGDLRSGQINNSERGNYSVAFGSNNTASGDFSSAIGFSNSSSGQYSATVGRSNIAGGTAAIAIGQNSSANGAYTTAMGQNSIASGNVATAMGYSTTASGSASTALGDNTNATGNRSTAMGQNSTAAGNYSTAIGSNTNALGNYSTSMGGNTTANNIYATSLGYNTMADGAYSTSTGKYTNASGYASTATGDSCLSSGVASFSGGFQTTASGNYSNAFGFATTASGEASTALGLTTIASGDHSTTMGRTTFAIGSESTAMGYFTTASGSSSTAMGNNTLASGLASTAIGYNTTASGFYSTAVGYHATAIGSSSIALGTYLTANGSSSIAMGSYVNTNNYNGSFLVGDLSTTAVMNGVAPNNFRARFAGGYKLFTSANYSTGCTLLAGDNAWTTGSDVHSKENFAQINGEDFLKKISNFNLTSWNYKTQNPTTFRHYGPMAQDFYAAFGKDKYGTIGNDTTINSADFAGVSFVAIQALEKRTQKIEGLEKENAALKAMLLQLRKEMDKLKKKKL